METQKAYFNSVADVWDEICKHDMAKVEYFLDLLEIKPGDYVLDVGTGTGILISNLYDRVTPIGQIKAVDLSDRMIEIAKNKYNYDNVIFRCRDVLSLDGDEGKYDHIICYSMFPHFQSRKEEAIKKLSGKLKKGGRLMVCHSQSRNAINRLHKKIEGAVQKDHLPTMDRMSQYFLNADLKPLSIINNDDMYVIMGSK